MKPSSYPLTYLPRVSVFASGVACLLAACALPAVGHAQTWVGAGAGGTGTDFDTAGNWTNNIIGGSFANDTTTATVTLSSASTTVTSLNFAWATDGISLNLNSDVAGSTRVLSLATTGTNNGVIFLPSVTTSSSTVTLSADVTLDFGTFSTNRVIEFGGTPANALTNGIVFNGLVTGTATGTAAITSVFNTKGNPSIAFNNTGNTFDAPLSLDGATTYNSIGNVSTTGIASSLGAPTTAAHGVITLVNGSALNYTGTTNQSSNRTITMTGAAPLRNTGSSGTDLNFTGTVNIPTAASSVGIFDAVAGTTLEVSGQIVGPTSTVQFEAGNTSTDTGTVLLSGTNNTYTGLTNVVYGTLAVSSLANGGSNSSIGSSSNAASNIVIRGDHLAVLEYVGSGSSTDRLFTVYPNSTINASGTGAVNFTGTGSIAFANTNTATPLNLTGTSNLLNTMTPALTNDGTGASSLNKNGTGTWALAGTNTYTGATTVNAGTLLINGSTSGSAFSVKSGATLGGTGTITLPTGTSALSVASGGVVSPGSVGSTGASTVGMLTLTSISGTTISFASGSTFAFDLTTPTGTSDQLAFTNLTAGTKSVTFNNNVVNFTNASGLTAGTYTLFTFDQASDYNGTLAVGSGLSSGSSFIYNANSIQLNVAQVPEASTWSMMVMVCATVGVAAWRRRTGAAA